MQRNDIEGGSVALERFLSQPRVAGSRSDRPDATENAAMDEDPAAVRALVWATTVDPNESMDKFKDFLLNFTVEHRLAYDAGDDFDPEAVSDVDKLPYYPRVLQQVCSHC